MTAWIPPIVDSSRVAWADSLVAASQAAPNGEYGGLIAATLIVAALAVLVVVGLLTWGVYSIVK
jgi:uncharacterized iron-regulated membrane protein